MEKEAKEQKGSSWLLIFLCWLVYASSYIGKVNYSANIPQVMDHYNVSHSQAGMVSTFFFFAYGAGQVVNGIFCRKYNIKWVVFGSMLASGAMNLIVALTNDFAIIKWLWLLNGFVMSALWPTLVRLFAEALPKKDLSKSSIVIGTTVASGTLIIYGLSAVYAIFHKFKLAFYTAGIVVPIVAVMWLLLYKKAVGIAKRIKEEEGQVCDERKIVEVKTQTAGQKKHLYMTIAILCFCAVGCNLIKDGLVTWVPSILKEEYGMNDSISILLTLCLPILSIFGNLFALSVHKKFPDYIHHATAIYFVSGGFIYLLIGCLSWKALVLTVIGFAVVSFIISSMNSLITSIFPIFMRGKVNSGLFAGILNGFCYLGSTISSYGLGVIAETFSWAAVFWTLFGVCVIACVLWCVYVLLKKRFLNQEKTQKIGE